MPFFLPSLSLNRFTSTESGDVEEPGAEEHQAADSDALQAQPPREIKAQEVVDPRVDVGGNHPHGVELNSVDAGQREGALQACSA